MTDTEIERAITRAGYEIRRDAGAHAFYAMRDGKRHTRSHPNLLALAEYLGCVETPVAFVSDPEGLKTALAEHAKERNPFAVQTFACRVAIFRRNKYVQLLSATSEASAMYELRTDGLRRISNGNLPPEIVAAFARPPRLTAAS